MARKDERGVVIPAPLQFNNSATARQPRYDDEHRGPAVTDSYELSHCRIDLAERSEGWPTPATLPPRMVDFARSVPEEQRADWLRRQANIEEADRHIANAMRSGELPIWVVPIGETERLVAPSALVEVDHATVVSGVYRPPNDRGWLYGRPLFVKRDEWVKFAERADAAKRPAEALDNLPVVNQPTTGAEKECQAWLIEEFSKDRLKQRTKADFQSAALDRFSVRLSVRGFNRAWGAVASDAGRSKPGRKS